MSTLAPKLLGLGILRWCSADTNGWNDIKVAKVRDDGRIMGVCHLAIRQENLEAQFWPFRFGNRLSVLQIIMSARMNACLREISLPTIVIFQ